MIFITVITLLIAQRIYELKLAKRNTALILKNGGIEFGANHYWVVVLLHTLFFIGLLVEAFIRGIHPPAYWLILFILFMAAQSARVWVIRTMGKRWTTRILVLPKEELVSQGPFKFISHPNYTVVAMEIFIFPLIFGLTYCSLIFTILNGVVLLGIRIPVERRALNWVELTRKQ